MNQRQELKMQLLKEFGITGEINTIQFCREAYKFLTEDDVVSQQIQATDASANGLYLVFKDGTYLPYDKQTAAILSDNVKNIGIIHDGHKFAVTLKDIGKFKLVRDYHNCPDDHPLYRRREVDALNDWDCIERTKHIQEVGTDIPLNDGEYIPSLPMLLAMIYWMDKGLNEALEFVGGEPIKSDNSYYWSSTEYGARSAWGVGGGVGNVFYYGGKHGSFVVRPVCAF